MDPQDQVNVLLVDDQPGKLLSHEVMLEELGENLIKTSSAKEALEVLLKTEVAVILIDVCMPELDGFELAAMIRDHPRFQRTAIIFISAIHISEADSLRGYDAGAVDYVPVPVVPEVLRAKVRVFCELYRKTKLLERLNTELESRVAERTAAAEGAATRLLESERGRSLALAAGNMGSWEYNFDDDSWTIDEGQYRIFGLEPDSRQPTDEYVRSLFRDEDWERMLQAMRSATREQRSFQSEVRLVRGSGEARWCLVTAAITFGENDRPQRVSGVTIDITERKENEERQSLLAREVDHRARNALAVVQAIVRMSRAPTMESYTQRVEGRIRALSLSHDLLSQSRWQGADIARLIREEVAPYQNDGASRVHLDGPSIILPPDSAQTIALAVHELATNAAKYGALSDESGRLDIQWKLQDGMIELLWRERGGPVTSKPTRRGFGTKIIDSSINARSGGDAKFEWLTEGLRCTLLWQHANRNGHVAPRAKIAMNGSGDKTGPRILVVEDEPLVGMLTKELLHKMGYSVMGPVNNLEDAVKAGGEADLELAVLDVNLAGETVFPVARVLSARQIPFVFLTGYEKRVIEEEFRSYPVLQKPIDADQLEIALRSAPSARKIMFIEVPRPLSGKSATTFWGSARYFFSALSSVVRFPTVFPQALCRLC